VSEDLETAARRWLADLIPNTSTSTAYACRRLREAIERLDDHCPHPREVHIFHGDGARSCGRCATPLYLPTNPTDMKEPTP
jgi:hypothetical protein